MPAAAAPLPSTDEEAKREAFDAIQCILDELNVVGEPTAAHAFAGRTLISYKEFRKGDKVKSKLVSCVLCLITNRVTSCSHVPLPPLDTQLQRLATLPMRTDTIQDLARASPSHARLAVYAIRSR